MAHTRFSNFPVSLAPTPIIIHSLASPLKLQNFKVSAFVSIFFLSFLSQGDWKIGVGGANSLNLEGKVI